MIYYYLLSWLSNPPVNNSQLLYIERELFSQFEGCPHTFRCFGDDVTIGDGEQWYNILLEYAAGGSLADRIQSNGRGKGWLVNGFEWKEEERVQESSAKIADLGLVKKAGERLTEKGIKLEIKGTALYMAPESIRYEDYEPEADIWALGCTILELLNEKNLGSATEIQKRATILIKIASTQEIPEIWSGFSKEAEDFLNKCLVRDPKSWWTADMLLGHPFASATDGVFTESIMDERNRVVHPKAA